MARPRRYHDKYEPTDESRALVRDLYAAGIRQERIAEHLEIDPTTLRKYYRNELDISFEKMIGGMVSNLFQDAMNGDKQSREFWLKTRGGLYFAKAPDEQPVINLTTALEQLNDTIKAQNDSNK